MPIRNFRAGCDPTTDEQNPANCTRRVYGGRQWASRRSPFDRVVAMDGREIGRGNLNHLRRHPRVSSNSDVPLQETQAAVQMTRFCAFEKADLCPKTLSRASKVPAKMAF
jgi:hypothetical protein